MSKNGLQKLQKQSFLTKEDSFLKKNTNKIETSRPGDVKLRSKTPLEYPLHDQKCFQIFFSKKLWCKGPQLLIKDQGSNSGTQHAITHGPENKKLTVLEI